MSRTRCVVLALLAVVGMVGCRGDTTATLTPGVITAFVHTPNVDDGALLVSIEGPGLINVRPFTTAYQVYWRQASATELRAIIIGNIVDGSLFTAEMPVGAAAGDYRATVLQVATRADADRPATGYTVEIVVLH